MSETVIIKDKPVFDTEKKRDPHDRAIVDKLRQYAEARGGTCEEYDDIRELFSSAASFVFGWDEGHVVHFRCNGADADSGSAEVEPPPDLLSGLEHLRRVVTDSNYSGSLYFLGTLKELSSLSIFTMPSDEQQFPASWACASALRSLTLFYDVTSIRTIPDFVRGFRNIRTLSILYFDVYDRVIDLPEWLGEFPHLNRLWLKGYFSSIPYSLVKTDLPFTDDFSLETGIAFFPGTTLSSGDVSLYLSNNRELIEQFYKGEQITEADAVRECKVIFLGDGGAGKSSLIQRMMEDTFQLGKLPTDGMRVIPWETRLPDGRPFRLRFLDFGGQEIMHSMHRCFLSAHTVYVVVCAVRDDTRIDAAAARWLEQVKTYAPNCPVLLVLNKADENPGISVNETNLKNRFPMLKQVLKTSAAVSDETDKCHASNLLKEILKYAPACVQELRGNKGILAVKAALEELGKQKKYIKSEDFKALCESNGIEDEKLQQALLDWFRDLGVAYYYKKKELDMQLERLRVLDPVWLTNGMYRLILRAGDKVQNGILTHDDIREILRTPHKGDAQEKVRYSPEETEYVLHVMRMFEISHEMPAARELIPMLMDKNAQPLGFSREDALHLRWEGFFLPNNAIHKLMIQKYEELDQSCMWRTGARFNAGNGCRAAAEMTDDQSLDLYVVGEEDKKERACLESFRDRIWKILRSLNLGGTKEYICFTVNGKAGKMEYEDVVFSYEHGDEKVQVPGIREYVSPAELLKRVNKDPEKLLQRRRAEAEIRKIEVEALKIEADAKKTLIDAQKSEAETEKTKAETEKTEAETEKTEAETEKTEAETGGIHTNTFKIILLIIIALLLFFALIPMIPVDDAEQMKTVFEWLLKHIF